MWFRSKTISLAIALVLWAIAIAYAVFAALVFLLAVGWLILIVLDWMTVGRLIWLMVMTFSVVYAITSK